MTHAGLTSCTLDPAAMSRLQSHTVCPRAAGAHDLPAPKWQRAATRRDMAAPLPNVPGGGGRERKYHAAPQLRQQYGCYYLRHGNGGDATWRRRCLTSPEEAGGRENITPRPSSGSSTGATICGMGTGARSCPFTCSFHEPGSEFGTAVRRMFHRKSGLKGLAGLPMLHLFNEK
jgi:hypothetical protein